MSSCLTAQAEAKRCTVRIAERTVCVDFDSWLANLVAEPRLLRPVSDPCWPQPELASVGAAASSPRWRSSTTIWRRTCGACRAPRPWASSPHTTLVAATPAALRQVCPACGRYRGRKRCTLLGVQCWQADAGYVALRVAERSVPRVPTLLGPAAAASSQYVQCSRSTQLLPACVMPGRPASGAPLSSLPWDD